MSPARMAWRPLRWLFSRRAAKTLLWLVLIVAAAVGANVAGINLVGSVAGWERWLAASAGYFFIWRLCVYAATAYGWFWMRRRVLAREDQSGTDGQARRRLIRTEVAGVVSLRIPLDRMPLALALPSKAFGIAVCPQVVKAERAAGSQDDHRANTLAGASIG